MARLAAEDLIENMQRLSEPEVYKAFDTGPEGLGYEEVQKRLENYGPNTISKIQDNRFAAFFDNFTHLMALLLWAGGLIAFMAGLPQLGIAIWLVNLINGLFSYWQERRAEKAILALASMLPAYSRVMRRGHEHMVLANDLVPGDILLLEEGDRVSADARLVKESSLRMDQSTLTGESRPVRKSSYSSDETLTEPSNIVFAGTNVISGSGVAVVFATGMKTEFGNIASLTQTTGKELSPLQKEMKIVTRNVTLIALSIGLAFFFLALLVAGMKPAESFIFSIGMIVAFVPEGLLPTVTLSLAMGVQRMARRNALIKRLSVVEGLGSTTIICTDKTGTLTQNQMTVSDLWVSGVRLDVTGTGYEPDGDILGAENVKMELNQLLIAAGLCNNARLEKEAGQWTSLGDPTETALLVAAVKAGIDLHIEALRSPRLFELHFDPIRKRMTTVHQLNDGQIAYTKGTPLETLKLCKYALAKDALIELDDSGRAKIIEANDDLARRGRRVLAVAMRLLPKQIERTPEAVEEDLTFLGLAAMIDPPRPNVKEAVEKCHTAGIRIIMITGDYGLTAESIARSIGIIKSRPKILTGPDLDAMNDGDLKEYLSEEVVLARVTPEHKLRVVSILQELGHVVAVTGDGVNDAPALRKADVGVAMGSGTDVAKEAADMILTDDHFASIVNAVEEGRAVYANIRRFTSYIFTSNTPEAVPFILFAFSGGRIPLALNIMQILSVDLGTDIIPALALGAELPEPGLMKLPPRSRQEHLIDRSLLARSYLFLGAIQSIAAMSAFYFMFWTNGYWGQVLDLPSSGQLYQAATSMTLAAIVTTQIGNLFAQRTKSMSFFRAGMFGNPLIWVGIAAELITVSAIIYIPQLQWAFGTAAFPLSNWIFLFAWTPSLLLADELRKAWLRKRTAR
ncbi:MAG: cation-transporting P-type ATPase [Methanothrix sp.]|nr:cation-transporting P-type ATPase [Methanothrix sp.]OYV13654.1 MAG: HAD superfamily ATPase [Methanosaeta sp. ASM2]